MLTLTDPEGNPVHSTSGGTAGFKKSARSGYEAGYQAALSMFSAISARKAVWARAQGRAFSRLEVIWKGFGAGRDAVYRALLAAEGEETRNMVRSMSDATKLKVGGVRPRKRRSEYTVERQKHKGERFQETADADRFLFAIDSQQTTRSPLWSLLYCRHGSCPPLPLCRLCIIL